MGIMNNGEFFPSFVLTNIKGQDIFFQTNMLSSKFNNNMVWKYKNKRFVEIAPLLIMTKLEEYDYPGATALAAAMLSASFVILLVINGLQWWSRRHQEPGT